MTTAIMCSEKKGKFDFTCTFQQVQSMTIKFKMSHQTLNSFTGEKKIGARLTRKAFVSHTLFEEWYVPNVTHLYNTNFL